MKEKQRILDPGLPGREAQFRLATGVQPRPLSRLTARAIRLASKSLTPKRLRHFDGELDGVDDEYLSYRHAASARDQGY